ncbi:mRNA-capping enzyme-like protein, partial [Tanacetum coccineum]
GQLTTLEAAVLLYTWKADGTRYMMLLTRDGCYLIDRKFDFRSVNLRFPRGNANEVATGNTHDYTLFDGEMGNKREALHKYSLGNKKNGGKSRGKNGGKLEVYTYTAPFGSRNLQDSDGIGI